MANVLINRVIKIGSDEPQGITLYHNSGTPSVWSGTDSDGDYDRGYGVGNANSTWTFNVAKYDNMSIASMTARTNCKFTITGTTAGGASTTLRSGSTTSASNLTYDISNYATVSISMSNGHSQTGDGANAWHQIQGLRFY